jgi:hypothetical protein
MLIATIAFLVLGSKKTIRKKPHALVVVILSIMAMNAIKVMVNTTATIA